MADEPLSLAKVIVKWIPIRRIGWRTNSKFQPMCLCPGKSCELDTHWSGLLRRLPLLYCLHITCINPVSCFHDWASDRSQTSCATLAPERSFGRTDGENHTSVLIRLPDHCVPHWAAVEHKRRSSDYSRITETQLPLHRCIERCSEQRNILLLPPSRQVMRQLDDQSHIPPTFI